MEGDGFGTFDLTAAQVRLSPQAAWSPARSVTSERRARFSSSFSVFLRGKPFHRAASRIGLSGLRLTALRFRRLGFELQPHELLPPLVRGPALEPVEELRGRIDVIIVLALPEDSQ